MMRITHDKEECIKKLCKGILLVVVTILTNGCISGVTTWGRVEQPVEKRWVELFKPTVEDLSNRKNVAMWK
jgi:hypothetical protein